MARKPPVRSERQIQNLGSAGDFMVKHNLEYVCDNLSPEEACYAKLIRVQAVYLGEVGGKAVLDQYTILIHEAILRKPERLQDLVEVFIHELAHHIDFLRRGTSDHSKAWRETYSSMGGRSRTYWHNMAYLKEAAPAGLTKLHCDRPGCHHAVNTAKPESYAGVRLCGWCGKGRMQLTKQGG